MDKQNALTASARSTVVSPAASMTLMILEPMTAASANVPACSKCSFVERPKPRARGREI